MYNTAMENVIPQHIYTSEEAAKLLDINVNTLQKLVRESKIKAKTIGRKYRFTGQALLDYFDLEDVNMAALRLEYALIGLDLGHDLRPAEVYSGPFYNVTTSVVSRLAKESRSRAVFIRKLALFIEETRKSS